MVIEVPVNPHIKKYLVSRNDFLRGNLTITTTDPIGAYLVELIEEKKKPWFPLRYNQDSVISIDLSDYNAFRSKPYISKDNARKFNLFACRIFKMEFRNFVGDVNAYSGRHIDKLIRDFLMRYDLSEDNISFSAMKKDFYRTRSRNESRTSQAIEKNFTKSVPKM